METDDDADGVYDNDAHDDGTPSDNDDDNDTDNGTGNDNNRNQR